jgi:tRNA (guanine37-N1)-methyltransferase
MLFDILTLFPEMFQSPFRESIIGKAAQCGLICVRTHNIRDYATDKHHVTDDRPFGGGEGMVMKPEPIVNALDTLQQEEPRGRVVLLTPQGELFRQKVARRLSRCSRLILICGRYEGVDERVGEFFADEQISIGDYILTGGELGAMIIVDAVARLIPGVLGNAASSEAESFAEPLLEYPQYTRPQSFRGYQVPDILLSGHHKNIEQWRRGKALLRTKRRRPDLFAGLPMSAEDENFLERAQREAWEKGERGDAQKQ